MGKTTEALNNVAGRLADGQVSPIHVDGRDALSDALESLQTHTAVAVCFRLSLPYCIRKGDIGGVSFRIAEDVPFWLKLDGEDWVCVEPGDLVLLPHGTAHTMASSKGIPETSISELLREAGIPEWPAPDGKPPQSVEIRLGGKGPFATVVAGNLSFRDSDGNQILRSLPKLIHVRHSQKDMVPYVAGALAALFDEFNDPLPGWTYNVRRLVEVVFCQGLRAYLSIEQNHGAGWLRAMSDSRIGDALRLLHRDISSGWTVETLARAVGMSRARFASRFEELMNMSPMRYLTEARLAAAANKLASGYDVVHAANTVGYLSEKAFTRAFKRWAGMPPGEYRKLSVHEGAGVEPVTRVVACR